MKNLTLRQLRIFEAVARHSSFSRAAEALCLTQPAVSMQIKQLEEDAGLRLFKHTGKTFALTEAGNVMLHHSRVILSQFREVAMPIERLKTGLGRALRVGVITTGGYFFPQLVNAFTQRLAGVEFDLKIRCRDELVRQIAKRDRLDGDGRGAGRSGNRRGGLCSKSICARGRAISSSDWQGLTWHELRTSV
jgi:LysR family transcriptional regulator, low CO2-responsive transcriptional regulator